MDKIGKYDVVREIGQGASSTVYLGHDPFAQRDVAIKVVFPQILKDPERGKLYTHLFLNEASLVGKLNHPHIVQIFDAVVADSLCYIVMEYVPGGTLEMFCGEKKLLPVERVVEIIFKCTRALDFAYRLGITHRDIKPANILIVGTDASSGDIKISDFGAAITGGVDHTQVSGIGSPAYMSPQQVKEQTLDHRTDIYSLGVVMYQMLTGQLPYVLQVTQVRGPGDLHKLRYESVRTQRRELPAWLDSVLRQALQPQPNKRHEALSAFVHDLQHPAAQHLGDQQAPWIERDPVRFWRGLALVLGLVIVALVARLAGVLQP